MNYFQIYYSWSINIKLKHSNIYKFVIMDEIPFISGVLAAALESDNAVTRGNKLRQFTPKSFAAPVLLDTVFSVG